MASLLDRMHIPSTGAIRHKSSQRSSPYNRPQRVPKGDVDSQWTHDLYDSSSLAARMNLAPTAPRVSITGITQKALREAGAPARKSSSNSQLAIKGASTSTSPSANVVEVTNLASGTTAEDVAAIFKSCGDITTARLISGGPENPRIRLTYKLPASATTAISKFDGQPADGKVLSVRVVGATTAGTTLTGRLGGGDGLGLVREGGSVDVLMNSEDTGSKMRSDSLVHADPRAQVLIAPPGADPADYVQTPFGPRNSGARRGRGGRRGARRGGGGFETRMDIN